MKTTASTPRRSFGTVDRYPDHKTEQFFRAIQATLTRTEVADAFLGTAVNVIDAGAVGLYQLHPKSGAVLEAHAQVEAEFLDDYEEYGRVDDPVLEYVVEHRRPIDSSRLPGNCWAPSGARAALSVGGYEYSMEAPIIVSSSFFGTVNFARDRSLGPFAPADLRAAASICDHVGLAIERALRYEMVAHRSSVLENAVDRIPQALVVAGPDGRIWLRNRAARQVWEMCGTEGRVGSADPLARAVIAASAQLRLGEKRIIMQTVALGEKTVIAKSFRLAGRVDASATLLFDRSLPDAQQLPVWEVLTQREQHIAQLVSEGLTTKEIAARAFISQNTVKQHLKRVFAKTDVRNRAELMQLIWTSSAHDSPIA